MKKKWIVSTLLVINIIMLIASVIPHHHHSNGVICLKQDLPVEQQCTKHNHHSADDSCCNDECLTRFQSPTLSVHSSNGPDYVLVAVLFTNDIIEHLLRPLDKQLTNYFVFRESLHSTKIPRTSSLRAPPCAIFS